ncbi:pantothenate kinase [Bacteroidales bacterium MB20-C3-3]|jgi:type II pantothenate kinase|nr:pantothenate kinase [Bacteroidales bacterium MB20-C3-3]
MIIGIDIGSTTTKAVAVEGGKILTTVKTRAFDSVTSATGALGKMILENNFNISSIEKIIITGAGSININKEIFGITTHKIDEIHAIGLGGMFLAKRDPVVIANIGTGTSVIEASKERILHLGGTGVGGGTITGLSKELIKTSDFDNIIRLAEKGNLDQVDLLIGDISEKEISFLDKTATAANFGKMLDTAQKEDIAIGIMNMVFQVIGVISVFAARSRHANCVLVTGNGSRNQIGQRVLEGISRMYKIKFEFPPDAEYATAIGAALSEN